MAAETPTGNENKNVGRSSSGLSNMFRSPKRTTSKTKSQSFGLFKMFSKKNKDRHIDSQMTDEEPGLFERAANEVSNTLNDFRDTLLDNKDEEIKDTEVKFDKPSTDNAKTEEKPSLIGKAEKWLKEAEEEVKGSVKQGAGKAGQALDKVSEQLKAIATKDKSHEEKDPQSKEQVENKEQPPTNTVEKALQQKEVVVSTVVETVGSPVQDMKGATSKHNDQEENSNRATSKHNDQEENSNNNNNNSSNEEEEKKKEDNCVSSLAQGLQQVCASWSNTKKQV